jgi:succinate dehydrogenase/fumarate reductase flavoprotein subunit
VIDLLVLGGGMAGLTAAARASQLGQTVCVAEAADELGGSASYAGLLWAWRSAERHAQADPDGDPALRSALIDGLPQATQWARDLGVPVGEEITVMRDGGGRMIDTSVFIRACAAIVTRAGGEILLGASADRLLTDAGRVGGAVVTGASGRREIAAGNTLLATGGFQGDREALRTAIHPNAGDIPLRANPHSRGDGARLARQAGAAVGPPGAGFYGHLVVAGVSLGPADFTELTLYYSEHALAFNKDGRRFTDETHADHTTTMAAVRERDARVLVVCDQRVRDQWMLAPYVVGGPVVDRFAAAQRRGGHGAIAESIGEFADMPPEWGFDGAAIAAELQAFNEATATPEGPVPGRAHDPLPLDQPPYYAIEATAAITFTMAGVRVDAGARALDKAGRPVPGLLAAGCDASIVVQGYGGGLSPALVFGLAAAETAAAETAAAQTAASQTAAAQTAASEAAAG